MYHIIGAIIAQNNVTVIELTTRPTYHISMNV